MRILYILRNAEGGIRTHVEALMAGALAAGHEPLLITDLSQADKSFKESLAQDLELRKRVVSIRMRSAPGPWDLTTLWLLYIGLRRARGSGEAKFDVVHGHGAKGGLFARLCRILRILPKSTAVLYTPHGGSLHAMHGAVMNWLYVAIEKWLARSTDLVLVESRYSLEQFEKRIGPGAARTLLNRNGIAHLEPNLSPWPKGLGSAEPLRIGAFGLLRPIKGFDVLIQAVHLVRSRGFKVELNIWGEGRDRDKLVQLAKDLALETEIQIHRETSNALEKMRECHVVVQPSHFESFGLVSLEAQALGIAVIASRTGGLIDVVDDEHTGLLVTPADIEALANKVVWMIEHPDDVLLMRTRAAKRAHDEFSAEQMVNGALSAYKNVSDLKSREDIT
ncbi:polysaccharide biosynthesis type 4 glycosyltransferase UppD [soil metagenome]